MAAPGSKPLLIDEPTLRSLKNLLRRKYRGAGGIEVTTSPDGATVNIILRQKRGLAGGDGGTVFPVWLTQHGGADGDDGTTTTACFATWTYDAYGDQDKTQLLGEQAEVEGHRLLMLKTDKAAIGLARWDGDELKIVWCDEYFDRDACDASDVSVGYMLSY